MHLTNITNLWVFTDDKYLFMVTTCLIVILFLCRKIGFNGWISNEVKRVNSADFQWLGDKE